MLNPSWIQHSHISPTLSIKHLAVDSADTLHGLYKDNSKLTRAMKLTYKSISNSIMNSKVMPYIKL